MDEKGLHMLRKASEQRFKHLYSAVTVSQTFYSDEDHVMQFGGLELTFAVLNAEQRLTSVLF